MSCLPAHWQSNALGGVSHNYPMGSATNFIVSAVFPRISTACLPCDLASDSDLRTSLALPTVLPPTSRMISPDWKPCSAAEPAGSTSGTITPPPAGARPPRGEGPSTTKEEVSRYPAAFPGCRHWLVAGWVVHRA